MNSIDTAMLTLQPPAVGLIIEELQNFSPSAVPQVSTLCLPYKTTHDQLSLAFPICICILQVKRSNTGNGNVLETRLGCMHRFVITKFTPIALTSNPTNLRMQSVYMGMIVDKDCENFTIFCTLPFSMHIHVDHCRYYPGRCLKLNMQYPLG